MQSVRRERIVMEPLSQYPNSVVAFSSQYGSSTGSYSSHQLVGNGPTVYPRYGDFCEACVLRYYGNWWSKVPSSPKPVGKLPNCFPDNYCSEDFIEVAYSQPVYLSKVRVYETFMPGCIVSIYARSIAENGSPQWQLVWRRSGPSREPHAARIFEPELLRRPRHPVDRLWLELNSSLAEYYTEIDTVELVGFLQPMQPSPSYLSQQVEAMQVSGVSDRTFARQRSQSDTNVSVHISAAGWFGMWPPELLSKLLGYLDLRSLLRISQACQLLWQFSSDPLLYKSVSLRPYCLQLTDAHLPSLANRMSATQHMELSWCSGFSAGPFSLFLHEASSKLTTLRLANCSFLDDQCLAAIGTNCKSIIDLDISGCPPNVTPAGFYELCAGLKNLRRLNLCRSGITWPSLAPLIASNPGLRHLNLGACVGIAQQGNEVAVAIGRACPDLRSLDMWRNQSLGCSGLTALAIGCPGLLELDMGWCSGVESKSGCLTDLVQRCRGLRKIFLTANRSVSDVDLEMIARCCKDLRQLDILGTSQVSEEMVLHVLTSCTKLEMFDVSFCGNVSRSFIDSIREAFPYCALQMSFQDQQ